jgi:O-antigen/teichoic acid export membrane protein
MASTVLNIITALVFVPLYLRYVGTDAYGVWLASGNVLAWLSIIDPGIGDLARQRIASLLGAGRGQEVRSSLNCGLLAMAAVAAIVAILGLGLAGRMVSFLRIDDPMLQAEAVNAIRIAAVGAALVILGNYLGGALQGLQLSTSVGIIGMMASLAVPIIRLVLLSAGFSLASFGWATVGQGVLLCLASGVAVAWMLRQLPPGPAVSLQEMRYLFSMSLFTSASRIAGTISNNMLAAIVTRYLGPSATVAFEMTRQPIEIARTFLDKPASAFLPSFAHLAGEQDAAKIRHYVARYLHYLIWTLGLAVVGFWAFNRAFITVWVGPALFAGPVVNGLLIAGLVAAAFGNTCRLFLYAFGQVAVSSAAALAETVMSVLIAVIAVRIAGTDGLAAAPLLAFLLVGVWFMPRIILWGCLHDSERSSLLREAVLPSCGAALAAAAVLRVFHAEAIAAQGWALLAVCAIITAVLYALVLSLLSVDARSEFRRLLAMPARVKQSRTSSQRPL